MKVFDLTLIVPSDSDYVSFNFFLENMTTWSSLPKEVIFVMTSKSKIKLDHFNQKFLKKKIKFYFYIIQIYFQVLQEILELKTRHIKLFHFLILEHMLHQIG